MTKQNENRPGYKKTQVGWIPEKWELKNLVNLSLNGISNGAFNNPQKVGSGYKLINVVDLYSEPKIQTENLSLLDLTQKEFEGYKVQYGDVFFTRSSLKIEGIAHCNIYLEKDENVVFECHIMRLRPNSEYVTSLFLRAFCLSYTARKMFMSHAKTTTMTTISQSDIASLPIALPPLLEQKKIAEILSTWDRAIEKSEKLIEKSEVRKKGLLNQLIVNSEKLKVNTGEWKKVKLKELFSLVKRKNVNSATRVLTASGEHGLIDQTEYFNRSVAGKELSNYYLLKKGEFAYNRSFMNGYPYGAIKRLERYDEGVVSTLYLCFSLQNEHCDETFYTHLFESGVLNKELRCIVQMGARAHGLLNVTASDFFNMKISFPPIKEQKKIAKILDTADKEINKLKSKLEALKEQKKGLMQKLLTGEVRTLISI